MEYHKTFTNLPQNSKSLKEETSDDTGSYSGHYINMSITSENSEEKDKVNNSVTKREIDIIDGVYYESIITIEPSSLDLLLSKKVNREKKWFICAHCNKNFSLKSFLIYHMETHTENQTYQCKICYLSFSTSSVLQNHIKETHTQETQEQCENESLETENINNEKDVEEEINTTVENEEVDLTDEEAPIENDPTIHSPEIPPVENNLYKCEQCRKPFGRPDFNRKESRPFIKNPKQIFKCNYCKRELMQDGIIQYHLTTHPPLICDFCHGAFTTKYSVSNRSNRVHGKNPRKIRKKRMHKKKPF
ncbi:Zinc finger C2H2-type,Zinc finger, RING/FYVE/PHD-type [Cinara cedri]|uniref:Zinc finger C2H2-type,Zinc finger, RING/FYVE/PHD-type n=1 Tax=Cinara cedri TaxID=506608 RepID=A0A5E4MFL0_9HEMI|nr:Zinc finger C2H2-type,Zinc finger, RING/FYVE/PHD-type [Cinara cedri]